MEKKGHIYKITSPTGRIYVGKSTRINDRISNYRSGSNLHRQRILYNSIKKYGWDNHIFEIIDESPVEKLAELEIFYIEKLNSYRHNNIRGMNLTKGGDGAMGRKDTLESIKKRVEKIKGRKHSENTKKLMSLKKKGKPSPNKGVPCPESTKQKISQANKGRIKSKETLDKIKIGKLMNLIKKHEAILQIDIKTGEVVKEWVMLPKDIGRHFTKSDSNISKCLKNKVRQAHKYFWRYKK